MNCCMGHLTSKDVDQLADLLVSSYCKERQILWGNNDDNIPEQEH